MKLTVKVVSILTIMILLMLIPAGIILWSNQQKTITEQARSKAVALYQMIVVTRQWVAENRDRIEPVPAEATKELSKYADQMADFTFSITSDVLINPDNKPDEFELRAIDALKNGQNEYTEKARSATDGSIYRYAAPLYINKSCMPCHSYQGYQIGEFRGLIAISIPLEDLEKAVSSGNTLLIFATFLSFSGLIIAVCFILYKFVLMPITTLTNGVGRVQLGDYKTKTDIKTDDELQELSEAFDMMSEQIAENENQLKARLEEAVDKYVTLVSELKESNLKLNSLNTLKTDLLDSIAHEIRTPLTKILSYTELLSDTRFADDNESREKFVKALNRNISSLTAMFNDIITMSRLEHGQHNYLHIHVKLGELISALLFSYEKEINEKELSVEVDSSPDHYLVADGETFKYALSNIIYNAVKYSKQRGSIYIQTYLTDEHVVIVCEDDGVGIPSEDLRSIFARFHRGSNVKSSYPGTGLGLAIVNSIIKSHDGEVNITSEVNKFTKIILKLPKHTII